MIGHHQNITVTSVKDIVSIEIVQPKDFNFANVAGLLGNYNGEMLARDGVTNLHHDINAMAQEWQVRDDEPMLFRTIRPPQAPLETCRLPSEVSMKKSRRLGEKSLSKSAAELACSHYRGQSKATCVYDVMASGDVDIATAIDY